MIANHYWSSVLIQKMWTSQHLTDEFPTKTHGFHWSSTSILTSWAQVGWNNRGQKYHLQSYHRWYKPCPVMDGLWLFHHQMSGLCHVYIIGKNCSIDIYTIIFMKVDDAGVCWKVIFPWSRCSSCRKKTSILGTSLSETSININVSSICSAWTLGQVFLERCVGHLGFCSPGRTPWWCSKLMIQLF